MTMGVTQTSHACDVRAFVTLPSSRVNLLPNAPADRCALIDAPCTLVTSSGLPPLHLSSSRLPPACTPTTGAPGMGTSLPALLLPGSPPSAFKGLHDSLLPRPFSAASQTGQSYC